MIPNVDNKIYFEVFTSQNRNKKMEISEGSLIVKGSSAKNDIAVIN